jgi:hypothetical protein
MHTRAHTHTHTHTQFISAVNMVYVLLYKTSSVLFCFVPTVNNLSSFLYASISPEMWHSISFLLPVIYYIYTYYNIHGGSNMTGTNCHLFTHKWEMWHNISFLLPVINYIYTYYNIYIIVCIYSTYYTTYIVYYIFFFYWLLQPNCGF